MTTIWYEPIALYAVGVVEEVRLLQLGTQIHASSVFKCVYSTYKCIVFSSFGLFIDGIGCLDYVANSDMVKNELLRIRKK
jgi:hypothetical protein